MKHTNTFRNFAITLIVGWLAVFVFVPNLMILVTSFLTRDDVNLIQYTFSLDSYLRLFDPLYLKVVFHSLKMACVATGICLLIGYPFAYFIAQMPKRWQPLALFLVIVPFWTNSLIRAYALKTILGMRGLFNWSLMSLGIIDHPIRILYTETAVIIGLIYILLPFMVLPLYSSIEKLDKRLLEASHDLGAGKLQTFWRIVIPLTMPGIIAGCLLVFIPAMGMFYIPDLLGGAKNLLVGNVIKSQFLDTRDWPFGSALSVMLTLLMALLVFIYYRVGKFLNKKVELHD
ncbi:spermidine/putrescine ABC transporter permease PotB [Dongshaea marina]|uniref:spermidine/putrescine ABC transporter permease PotB n=1 Tax=Dongshaea marina TaxID=2047966 RepID=UPI000D3E5DD1|nr:spermidine/putrescine ABC transporter permease PotB [Dongshaea marina]